jgi:hypothetical protein
MLLQHAVRASGLVLLPMALLLCVRRRWLVVCCCHRRWA